MASQLQTATILVRGEICYSIGGLDKCEKILPYGRNDMRFLKCIGTASGEPLAVPILYPAAVIPSGARDLITPVIPTLSEVFPQDES